MSTFRKSLPCVITCTLAAVLTGTSPSAVAAIRYVNAARPDDSGNGLSWAAAEKTLQAALVSAFGGDQIWVAAGVYKPDQGGGQAPGNRSATFQLVSNVAVYGGFAGGETLLSQRDIAANPTILSGDLSGNDIPVGCVLDSDCFGSFGDNCLDGTCNISAGISENSFHVVTGTSAPMAILDGFTVTAGNANGGAPDNRGGGMTTNGGSPIVTNCLFTRNFAIFGGGGMYNSSNGATVTSCTFLGNTCGNGGGGGGSGGGGMVIHVTNDATIAKCTFRGNVSKGPGGGGGGDGGGLNITGGSTYAVFNCAFLGNQAATGGGMAISSAGGPIANLAFSGNSATNGGAFFFGGNSTLISCTYSRNTATNQGGGIYTTGSPTILNSILWENSDAGGMDESAQIHAAGGVPFVNFSIVQGGWTGGGGNGNSAGDPTFVDADGPDNIYGTPDDDLALISPGSPAIDSGSSGHLSGDMADLDGDGDTGERTPIDLAGNPRQVDDPFVPDTGFGPEPVVDMGAYEAQGPHVLYVDAGVALATAGANNGSSWANALPDLQDGLSLASITPSIAEIWVADGTYMPDGGRTPVGGAHVSGTGDRAATIQLLDNVAVYGGFEGGETSRDDRNPAVNTTTLSGDLLADDTPVACTQDSPDCDALGPGFGIPCLDGTCIIPDNIAENSHNVVNGSNTNATAILDGFTITAGNANGPSPANNGGGMYNSNGSPSVSGCTFGGNSASSGGGMFNTGSSPKVTDCTFRKNAGVSGGGMFNFSNSNPTVRNCTFDGNSSNSQGGGMMSNTGSTPVLSYCTFWRNRADNNGGAMTNAGGNSTVASCTFIGNTSGFGGAMFNQSGSDARVTNCLFNGNSASLGGAMANSDSATTPFIINCTFSVNSASSDGGGIYNFSGSSPAIRNSILWGNTDQGGMDESAQIHTDSGTPVVHFSTVQGGWSGSGLNNLSSDPLFFDVNGMDNVVGTIDDNLRLRVGSPAINAGNTLFVPADTGDLDGDGNTGEQTPLDLDGQPRLVAMVDQGAYEYFLDCNNNGVPDATDIALGTSQDCDGGGKFWQQNGIPDECDIATCPKPESCVGGANHGAFCTFDPDCDSGDCAGAEFYGCQDCNLNGVLDACDIQGATSQDSDFNGIPDECRFFTGDCAVIGEELFWTCPANWDLGGQYPDNEDSAAGISVALPDGAIVVLDDSVAIPNLWIQGGAELQMITPDTGIDVDQAIQIDGTLTMESCKIAANTPPLLTIRSGGKFQSSPCTSPGDPSTMTAAEIRIIGSDCFIPPCPDGGSVDLDESISFTSTGDLVIDGTLANGSCEEHPLRDADGNRLSYHTPPSYSSRGSSSTSVSGTVYMLGAPHMNIETSIPWELSGNFENQSVRPDCFHWSGGLNLIALGEQEFEVAATDVGAVAPGGQVAGGSQPEFAMGSVTIAGGASVTFRDSFDNNLSGQEPCTEAAYIGSLTLEAGASMSIQNCRVYYATLSVDPSATVSLIGCAELLATSVVPPPQVEPDPSGLNKTRFISFSVPGGAGETALRIVLNSLHHVVPPYSGGPSVPFTSFEGQSRWVGPPTQYVESSSSGIPFSASRLQCTAHYQDWGTVGLLHVTGSAITPSSSYNVENLAASCMGSEANCAAVSAPLSIATTRWGDVRSPYNPPDPSVQPDISDVSALVDKFRSGPGAPIKARALLAGAPGNTFGEITHEVLNVDFGFSHISACVDAFRGVPYPYTIASCP